jgi:hypothetical protein
MKERTKLRGKLTYANVVSTLCLFLLLSGGAAYAAGHLGKNAVGTKQLKKSSVTTAKIKKQAVTAAKVKKGTLTGTQINASTLGTVPTAQTAQTANSLAQPEKWHEVGAAGEPAFQGPWKNAGGLSLTAAFFKDHDGIVHLRGVIEGGPSTEFLFKLPQGYRPAVQKVLGMAVACSPCGATGVGQMNIYGTLGGPNDGGILIATGGATVVSLDGISFPAES